MTKQQRLKRLNLEGVSYKAMAKALGVSTNALRHYTLGTQNTISCSDQALNKLLIELEKILEL